MPKVPGARIPVVTDRAPRSGAEAASGHRTGAGFRSPAIML
ncbi:hypothetical protein [Lentzea sp. CC55]|nr:hypothetical protein [Lentzea sp. CC55]